MLFLQTTIFLCATYPHCGASEENHPKEQICGTFILSSSLSWALHFALNSPISPVATHCPQPFLLYPTLNTNTFPSHLVFNNPILTPPPGVIHTETPKTSAIRATAYLDLSPCLLRILHCSFFLSLPLFYPSH